PAHTDVSGESGFVHPAGVGPKPDLVGGIDHPGMAGGINADGDGPARLEYPVDAVPTVDPEPAGDLLGTDNPCGAVCPDGDVSGKTGSRSPGAAASGPDLVGRVGSPGDP